MRTCCNYYYPNLQLALFSSLVDVNLPVGYTCQLNEQDEVINAGNNSIFTITERIKIFANVLHWTSFLEWREDPRGKLYDDISDSPVWELSI